MTVLYTAPAAVLDKLRARFGVDGFHITSRLIAGARVIDIAIGDADATPARMTVGEGDRVTTDELDRACAELADIVIADADRKPLPLVRIDADWLLLDNELRVQFRKVVAYSYDADRGMSAVWLEGIAHPFMLSADVAAALDEWFASEGYEGEHFDLADVLPAEEVERINERRRAYLKRVYRKPTVGRTPAEERDP